MKSLRKRLTYANVMSSIAVFLVLGGGAAFAAGQLGKNTVGTKQLKKNAVNSAKVKDGSLLKNDFKSGQLPAGAQGPKGDPGAQGPAGAAGATKVTYRSEVQDGIGAGVFAEAEPECEPGETLIGGGGYFVNTANLAIDVGGTITANGPGSGSAASSTPGNWYVAGKNTTAGTRRFFGYAICATP